MSIYIILYLVFSISGSAFLLYNIIDDDDYLNEEWYTKILVMISCTVVPLVILFIIGIGVLEKYVKSLNKKRKEKKLRKEKIKLGIIKISPLDPYGEENWNE